MRFPNAPVTTTLLLYYFGSSTAAALSATATATAGVEDDAPPMITPAPVLDLREERGEAQLIGYNSTDGSYVPHYCQTGSTLSYSDRWVACVATGVTRYIIPTGCFVDLGLTASGTSWPCTQQCQSTFIIERNGLNVGETLYTCGSTNGKELYYRTPPITSTATATATNPSSASAESIATSQPSNKASNTNTATESSPTATATTTSARSANEDGSSDAGSKPHHKDLAWIAGPIVGGVAAIVIAALVVWIVKLQRKKRQEEEGNAGGTGRGELPVELPDGDPTGAYYPAYRWQVEGQQSPPRQGVSSNGYMVPTHWQGPWATVMKHSSGSSSPKELDTGMTPVELYAGSPTLKEG